MRCAAYGNLTVDRRPRTVTRPHVLGPTSSGDGRPDARRHGQARARAAPTQQDHRRRLSTIKATDGIDLTRRDGADDHERRRPARDRRAAHQGRLRTNGTATATDPKRPDPDEPERPLAVGQRGLSLGGVSAERERRRRRGHRHADPAGPDGGTRTARVRDRGRATAISDQRASQRARQLHLAREATSSAATCSRSATSSSRARAPSGAQAELHRRGARNPFAARGRA